VPLHKTGVNYPEKISTKLQLLKQSLSILSAIFQVNLSKPVFTEGKDDGSGGDNWSYSRAKLQSNHYHQQTNTQFFTGRMPFLSPNRQCQSNLSVTTTEQQNHNNPVNKHIEINC